ncbi:cellulose binding domain-containing protein [Anaeromicropila populeti]|uniref:Alpha/beta hydrolase family protein n=1 Tax=Anaeromicropila populeti TaxID=37658 RepID=A0A1I6K693_9FIRM|nr:cellulose binding domain-containing protein [Anaeromicropila populeti]SFR86360.1 Alpha/beta hydrolase family protein [Anaeromicropila populeti]
MKKRFITMLLFSFLFLSSFLINSPAKLSAQSTNEINNVVKLSWDSGFVGELQVTNTGTEPIEEWKLQFDFSGEITGLWCGSITSHEDNHYVVSCMDWNNVINPGETVTVGFVTSTTDNSDGITNISLTDIIDELNQQDLEWQNYSNYLDYQAYQKSFADFFITFYSKFESANPHRIGYQLIEKNPVSKFTSSTYQNVTIPTSDGLSLKGLFFPVENPKGTLVVAHGRATNMHWTIQNVQFLIDNGYQVLLYNARFWNYYNTPEAYAPASYGCDIKDVKSAADYLKTRTDVDASKIGVYGFSAGANKAIVAGGLYDEFKVLVVDGASCFPFFTENDGVYSSMLPPNWFDVRDSIIDLFTQKYNITEDEMKQYDYDIRMDSLTKPVILLQGMNDPYVSLAETQKFYNMADGPKEMYTFENAAHCDAVFTADKDAYETAVISFLDNYLQ